MLPLTVMQTILFVLLAVSGYFAVIQLVNASVERSSFSGRNIWAADIVITVIYALLCLMTGVIYVMSDYDAVVLYFSLLAASVVLLSVFVRFCIKNRNEICRKSAAVFMVYFAVVLYLTVFSRSGQRYSSVSIRALDELELAVKTGEAGYINHMILNVIMFVPFGYLVTRLCPDKLKKWSVALFSGLAVSTVIEGIQMVFSLGNCDVDDIIANTAGAAAGYLLMRFISRIEKNWKVF